ncbi:MAG TPA: hypothetical protein ENN20_08950 [Candidatus Marinimicrobia bacterium]|nr:hypothetical protein [Candidatus Neomarinimicrobiota bacterium]
MNRHFHQKKKKRLQRGDKLVLKIGIPATILTALIIQLTVRGVPVLLDNIITFINQQAERSRRIIAGYAAQKEKDASFRTEKKYQVDESYEIGTFKYSSNPYKPSKEDLIRDFEKYRKNQTEGDDAIYQEIQRRERKQEIEKYQEIFKEEKDF